MALRDVNGNTEQVIQALQNMISDKTGNSATGAAYLRALTKIRDSKSKKKRGTSAQRKGSSAPSGSGDSDLDAAVAARRRKESVSDGGPDEDAPGKDEEERPAEPT